MTPNELAITPQIVALLEKAKTSPEGVIEFKFDNLSYQLICVETWNEYKAEEVEL